MSLFDFFRKKNKENELKIKFLQAAKSDQLNNQGVYEYRNGNIYAAIDFYEQALAVMPHNDDALINLAMCLNKIGLHEKAVSLCKKAIEINPDRPESYRTIGDAFFAHSQMFEVVKWYKKAASLGDKSTFNWLKNNGYIVEEANEIFKFLKEGNNLPAFGEIKFRSNTHQRYEKGNPVMGLQEGHLRDIKIEKNIADKYGYLVSILNPEPNAFTGNVSMAPKPMEIIEAYDTKVELIGFGFDKMSNSPFSDYGLSLSLNNDKIEKAVLHMYNKDVDIEYLYIV